MLRGRLYTPLLHTVLFHALLPLVAASAFGAPLRRVEVSPPDLGCLFDADCSIATEDSSGAFGLGTGTGKALLHTRLFPAGEPGTAGEGLTAYQYRLDLQASSRLTSQACVTRLTLSFGPIARLDYDADGESESVFVVAPGGPGSRAPSAVETVGGSLVFHFAKGVCAGESTWFFGAASKNGPAPIVAVIRDSAGETHGVEARAAEAGAAGAWWRSWQVWLVLAVLAVASLLMLDRRR